ncbi:MAG TPA: DUF1476 domain-containing protein [Sphingomonas sp.]|nr:DUF1476 domain-containing protein [Sphingomonas sp.]
MTTFDDRERAFENKYAREEEMAFRVTARRNRLLGVWAAGLMSLTPEETDAYCKAVVQAEFEESGDEDVVRKLHGDLISAGAEVDEATIRLMMEEKEVEARRQLLESM